MAGSPVGNGLDIDPGWIASGGGGARAPVDVGGYPTRRAEPKKWRLASFSRQPITLHSMDMPSRPGARSVPCGMGRGASVVPRPAHGEASHHVTIVIATRGSRRIERRRWCHGKGRSVCLELDGPQNAIRQGLVVTASFTLAPKRAPVLPPSREGGQVKEGPGRCASRSCEPGCPVCASSPRRRFRPSMLRFADGPRPKWLVDTAQVRRDWF